MEPFRHSSLSLARGERIAPEPDSRRLQVVVRRMNPQSLARISGISLILIGWGGCASDPNRPGLTDPRQPGPAVGQAVGATVGAVGGNAVGAVVGVGEGAAAAARVPFNNTRRVVRHWKQETTSDGRVIQVPVDIEVDSLGRPLTAPKPAKK